MSSAEYSLYILRCADDSLYTGIAIDVDRRLTEHQQGKRGARYLRGRSPLELVYRKVVGDRSRASQIEYRIKKLSKIDKEDLVQGRATLESLLFQLEGGTGSE